MCDKTIALLDSETKKLSAFTKHHEKMQLLYSIIQIKAKIDPIKYRSEIYIDIKSYFDQICPAMSELGPDYDVFDASKALNILKHVSYRERLRLLFFLLAILRSHNYNNESDQCIELIKKARIKYLIADGWTTNGYFQNALIILGRISSYNLFSLVASLIAFTLLIAVFLLPGPFGIFLINYEAYSDEFIINHFMNIFSLLVGLDNDLKIRPLTLWAFVLTAATKAIFIFFVLSYISSEIERRFGPK